MDTATATALGANSEVGTLRTVIVHRPDLAHERLSPTNCHELLFDDVIWVRRARQEYDAFVDLMRERGVEVLLFHDLLTETLEQTRGARVAALAAAAPGGGRRSMFSDELTAWMTEMPADELATRLTGGVTVQELPDAVASVIGRALRPTDFVIAPLPNHLFMRDTSAWIYGGVSINHDVLAGAAARDAERRGGLPLPPALPRRRLPDLVRRRRPRLGQARRSKAATSCRSATASSSSARASGRRARAVSILAQNLFAADAARLVIGAQMPRERAAMHLDTVFTFCDRNVVHDLRAGRRRRSCRSSTARRRRRRHGGALRAAVPRRGQGRARARGAEGRHDGRRRVRGRTHPVGRRQQRRRALTRRRRRLRAQRGDQREARRRRASRCSRSPARSSAAGAAAATA